MPTLKITITAALPDEPLEAFRERHEIEAAVLVLLETLSGEPREIGITCDVEGGELKLSAERKKRGPNRRKGEVNGEAPPATFVVGTEVP